MVESPGNALSSGLVSAHAVDAQFHGRMHDLAKAGQTDPQSLKLDEIKELCSTLLTLLEGASQKA